jgi:hypothetical protein
MTWYRIQTASVYILCNDLVLHTLQVVHLPSGVQSRTRYFAADFYPPWAVVFVDDLRLDHAKDEHDFAGSNNAIMATDCSLLELMRTSVSQSASSGGRSSDLVLHTNDLVSHSMQRLRKMI